jgi:hypothetical protein
MPIIGHGDIAGAIPADLHPDWTWFASGVSNSREVRIEAYDRERALLKAQPRATHLVYFSSLCVFHGRSLYSTHKDVMELAVKRLFNHLRARQAAGLPLDVQPVQRVVHTLADFRYCLALIPDWPCELSAPGRLLSVEQIVREFVTWDYQAVPA